jgi:hypothetical protein
MGVLNVQRCNKKEQDLSTISLASIEHGYGSEMAKDETQEIIHFEKQDIVIYEEPESIFLGSQIKHD